MTRCGLAVHFIREPHVRNVVDEREIQAALIVYMKRVKGDVCLEKHLKRGVCPLIALKVCKSLYVANEKTQGGV